MIVALRDVRREIEPQKLTDTSGDAYLLVALRQIEARFERLVGYGFTPVRRTITIRDAWAEGRADWDGERLWLPQPLLAVETVVNGDSGTLDTGDYRTLGMDPPNPTPWNVMHLMDGTWVYDTDETGIQITGVWGFHADYPDDAWTDSGDTLQDAVDDAATTFEVADADGADARGVTPRFSPGQLVQVEEEWVEVTAVDAASTTNTITVRRGVNGSTAAEHDAGKALGLWTPDPDVARAIARWTALAYTRRGAFETVTIQGMGAVKFPADMPREVRIVADYYRQLLTLGFLGV